MASGSATNYARVAHVAQLVEVHHAEVMRLLERQDPCRFDGFTLSNVLDGPDDGFRVRLAQAVRRAGTPDAPVLLRTPGAGGCGLGSLGGR